MPTPCSVPPPVNSSFIAAIDTANPTSYVIATIEETYKPVFKLTTDGIRTLPYQPFFNAYLTGNQTGLISRPGSYCNDEVSLVANTVISNIGENYNTTTGLFTAPVSGAYKFDATITAQGFEPSLLEGFVNAFAYMYESSLTLRIAGTRPRGNKRYSDQGSPSASRAGNGLLSFRFSRSVFMEANWTAQVSLTRACSVTGINSFSDPTLVLGTGTTHAPNHSLTTFSGYLIG